MILTAYDSISGPYTRSGLVIGYIDGQFAWSTGMLRLPTVIGKITVLANPMGEIFDVERGNASWVDVTNSINHRSKYGLPSIIYCNVKTLRTDPRISSFIKVVSNNAYLWVADWESVNGPNGQRMGAGDVSYPINEAFHDIMLNNRTVGWQWASGNNHDISIIDTTKWPLHIDSVYFDLPLKPPSVGSLTLGGKTYSIINQ